MRSEKKGEKAREATYKEVVASVTEEMAQLRIANSARADTDEQNRESHGKPTTQRSGRAAKTRIEQYGTGTPRN